MSRVYNCNKFQYAVPQQFFHFGELRRGFLFTPFNKVETITEGLNSYKIEYYPNQQKAATTLKHNNTVIEHKYYAGKAFEWETVNDKKYYYVYAEGQPIAVFMQDGDDSPVPYLILTDHLGSVDLITDRYGNVVDSMSFDAWGIRRNYQNWQQKDNSVHLIDRGFTMHQHLDSFKLINMEGRVYDPVVAQFLSPDPYVQAPDNTQGLNRYSYCMNSPLMYTDPTGEFITAITFVWDFFTTILTKGAIDPWNTPENRREAWKQFDPSANWSKTNKSWKIDCGLFTFDQNRNTFGRALQFVSRFSWELPQTIVGNFASHTRNIAGGIDNVDYYGGATLVNNDAPNERWDKWGFTLGPYINSKNVVANPYTNELFRHEYGHTLQSRLVGPFYLTNVALPSLISAALDYNLDWFNHNHDRSWFETQANRMSYRYFTNHESAVLSSNQFYYGPRQGPLQTMQGIPWNNNEYPRKYDPTWYWLFSPPLPLWLLF
jgi:RHS repeat-associated protein